MYFDHKNNLGGFSTTQVLGWGASIIVIITSFFWTSLSSTNSSVDEVKLGQTAIVERTAKLEANTDSMREDIKEIKTDVKSLLKVLK